NGLSLNRNIDLEAADARGVEIRRGHIKVACADLRNARFLSAEEREPCSDNPVGMLEISPYSGPLSVGLVYAPDRLGIGNVTSALLNTWFNGRHAFALGEVYQNSLNRFSYLVQTLQFLVLPASMFGMFVIVYVLNFQIDTWISHGKKHYGVLLARGFLWHE